MNPPVFILGLNTGNRVDDSTLNVIISSLGGTLTALATGMMILQERDKARLAAENGNGVKPRTLRKGRGKGGRLETMNWIRQTGAGVWRVAVGAGIGVGILLLAALWILPRSVKDLPTSPEAILDSFEQEIAPEWDLMGEDVSMGRTGEHAFAGRSSLVIKISLSEQPRWNTSASSARLVFRGRDLQKKLAIARVFVPAGSPTNLYAGFYLVDADGSNRLGDEQWLPPGKWATLVWSTEETTSWRPPGQLGIQFSLLPGTAGTDERQFRGKIYLDLFELLSKQG